MEYTMTDILFKKETISKYDDIMPGFPNLLTFYLLAFSESKNSWSREVINDVWINKDWVLEKGAKLLPNIDSNELADFLIQYDLDNRDNLFNGDQVKFSGILFTPFFLNITNKHIERFGLPIKAPVVNIHPIWIRYISEALDAYHPNSPNIENDWIIFWRDIKLKQILN